MTVPERPYCVAEVVVGDGAWPVLTHLIDLPCIEHNTSVSNRGEVSDSSVPITVGSDGGEQED